jgi:aspartyl-tRNA(Asn)/glutamyl-tRNA(Gln) amidotransferase subunit A
MTHTWTAKAIRDRVVSGEISATTVCRAFLDRVQALNDRLHALLAVDDERVLARAAEIDRRRHEWTHLPLLGVPIAVKDNISTRGLRTTAGSRMLETYIPPYDATVINRLEAAGAIVLGKTNCDEFAMGSSTEHSAFGPTHNPWALDRTPGGSSGGSAAAVAARLAPVALGSDTGGSIRQPAALCGVVGLKPTYGRVSRYGLIAFGSSLDQIGPLTHAVEDVALLFAAMAGADAADATSSPEAVPDVSAFRAARLKDVRIGVPRRLLADGVEPSVETAFRDALGVLQDRGATLVDVELPHAGHAIPVYYLVAPAEASSNLARYDGIRYTQRARLGPGDDLSAMYQRTRDEGFGDEVKRRIMLGTYVLSAGYYDAYYLKAQQVRTLIRRDFEHAFARCDALVTPVAPTTAFRIGEKTDDPLTMYLSAILTISVNLAGLPGLVVPCGADRAGLPVGLQVIGRPFDEAAVLRIGAAYEQASDWHRRNPLP